MICSLVENRRIQNRDESTGTCNFTRGTIAVESSKSRLSENSQPTVTLQGFAAPRTVGIGFLTFTRMNLTEIRVADGNAGRQPSRSIADRALPSIQPIRPIMNRGIGRSTGPV